MTEGGRLLRDGEAQRVSGKALQDLAKQSLFFGWLLASTYLVSVSLETHSGWVPGSPDWTEIGCIVPSWEPGLFLASLCFWEVLCLPWCSEDTQRQWRALSLVSSTAETLPCSQWSPRLLSCGQGLWDLQHVCLGGSGLSSPQPLRFSGSVPFPRFEGNCSMRGYRGWRPRRPTLLSHLWLCSSRRWPELLRPSLSTRPCLPFKTCCWGNWVNPRHWPSQPVRRSWSPTARWVGLEVGKGTYTIGSLRHVVLCLTWNRFYHMSCMWSRDLVKWLTNYTRALYPNHPCPCSGPCLWADNPLNPHILGTGCLFLPRHES